MGLLAKSGGTTIVDTPQKLADMLGVTYESLSGVQVTPETAMRFATVFTCIRVISESIGILPCELFEKRENGRFPASDHPVHRLIKVAPNEFMTAAEWKEMLGACLASRGNFYAWKNVVRGELRELLPLNPACVTPKLSDQWKLTYRVTFPSGRVLTLPQDQVLHIRLMAKDGVTGMSPIEYARESIGLAKAAEQQGARMFKQGTRLSGVLSTDGELKESAYKRVRDSWETTYSGSENAYKVAILEGGLKFSPISMSASDAQWVEGRKLQRSEIYGAFRVPAHKAGDLERSTNNNIEHQGREFVTDCLMPYLTKIEERYNLSLLSPADQARFYTKHNVNALLRGDMTARSNWLGKLIQNGMLSPNEGRELEDMNPREGGDVYLTPANMAIDGKLIEGNGNA